MARGKSLGAVVGAAAGVAKGGLATAPTSVNGLQGLHEAWAAYLKRTGHTTDPLVAAGGRYADRAGGQLGAGAAHLFVAQHGDHAGSVGAVVQKGGDTFHTYYTGDGHRVVEKVPAHKPPSAAVRAYLEAMQAAGPQR